MSFMLGSPNAAANTAFRTLSRNCMLYWLSKPAPPRLVGVETAASLGRFSAIVTRSTKRWFFSLFRRCIRYQPADTFGPTGPWMVTKDEIADPQNLGIWCEVNGKKMQNGSTKTMIFGVRKLVSYVSHFITLHAGDVIATGTPPGVGLGKKPVPVFLKAGQTMKLGIEGLGEQTQKLVAYKG